MGLKCELKCPERQAPSTSGEPLQRSCYDTDTDTETDTETETDLPIAIFMALTGGDAM